MSKKNSRTKTNRFTYSAFKTICLFTAALILSGLATNQTRGQDITVGVVTSKSAGFGLPGVLVEIGPYSVTTDDRGNGLLDIPLGTYRAKAHTPCRINQVIVAGNIVKAGLVSEPTLTFQAPKKGGYAVYFEIDCNAPPTAGTIKVKIATTVSCSDTANEVVTVQDGVSVSIGGRTYTSNIKGVIEIDLLPGKYPVSAAWKDYAFGFVSQNGLKAKVNEDGLPTVTLSDNGETLEVRTFTCDPSGREKARAVITEMGIIQNIRITRSNAQGSGFVGMQLRDGDTVVINGAAKLKWLDGNGIVSFDSPSNIIRIGPGSAPAGSTKPPGRSTLEILKGVGNFFIPKDDSDYDPADFDENGNRIRFRGSTNGVNVGVKGTVFSLAYDDLRSVTTVIVQEGVVAVTPKYPGQRPFELRTGQRAEVSPNGVVGPDPSASQNDPTVKTKKPVYAPGERIEVDYAHPTGHGWDHITIARPTDGDQSNVGSSIGSKQWISYTDKDRSGTKTFDGLAEGRYEARYISWDNGNNRATARSSFTVRNAPPPTPTATPSGTPIPTTTPPVTTNSSDLTGFWMDDTGGGAIYRVRQSGNKIYWTLDGTSKGEYVNVFHGAITGNTIDGEWLDMPGSPLRPALVAAALTLRIESNDRLVKVRSGNFYPAQVWTRQGTTSGTSTAAGIKCADGNPEKTVTIEVPANRAWTPTGISLNPCVEVRVEASGFIEAAVGSDRGAFYRGVPPAGRGQFHSDKPYQSVFALSMVGRIGDGPVLPIGTFARWYAGPPYGSGELFLGINDDGLSDNSGAWKARITTFGAAAPVSSGGGTGVTGATGPCQEGADYSIAVGPKVVAPGEYVDISFTRKSLPIGSFPPNNERIGLFAPGAPNHEPVRVSAPGRRAIEFPIGTPEDKLRPCPRRVKIDSSVPPGEYEFRIIEGFTAVARAGLTVTSGNNAGGGGGCSTGYAIQAPTSAAAGSRIKIRFGWRGASPATQSWIGLMKAGTNQYVEWYGVKVLAEAGCEASFGGPAPGNYEFRYYDDGGYDKVMARSPITIQGNNVGLIQKVIPTGVEKPTVEEIPDDAVQPTKSTGGIKKPDDKRVDQPVVEEIPDDVIGQTKDKIKKPEPVGDDKIEVEEIPDDQVDRPVTVVNPKTTASSNPPPVNEQKPKAKNPGGGFWENLRKAVGTAIKETNKPTGTQQPTGNPPPVYPPVGQQAGGLWNLVSVTVNPNNPPRDGGATWNYSKEGSSAQFTLYNGDRASFQWTIPPQQFDSRGFIVSIAGQGNPAANSRIAVTIGVSVYGLNSDTPSDQQSASVTAENSPATAQKSVTFTPIASASEIEVRVSFQWAVTYTYKYRRTQ